jgi:hypothetical protein
VVLPNISSETYYLVTIIFRMLLDEVPGISIFEVRHDNERDFDFYVRTEKFYKMAMCEEFTAMGGRILTKYVRMRQFSPSLNFFLNCLRIRQCQ